MRINVVRSKVDLNFVSHSGSSPLERKGTEQTETRTKGVKYELFSFSEHQWPPTVLVCRLWGCLWASKGCVISCQRSNRKQSLSLYYSSARNQVLDLGELQDRRSLSKKRRADSS